jgi:monofunctional biosynthetic peptidoglycan transglycosylase
VAWDGISSHLPIAAVAAEDQKFPAHFGFDLDEIGKALERNRRGGRLRGASTISQQVAKNLYLWPGQSFVRKGLEAYFTVAIEVLWPKRRILEVYLNVAEFGPGIFGALAASRRVFGREPGDLTSRQAATLIAVLPNPKRMSAANPSEYVIRRTGEIQNAVAQLGGTAYLRGL